jgi:hypothetical protein
MMIFLSYLAPSWCGHNSLVTSAWGWLGAVKISYKLPTEELKRTTPEETNQEEQISTKQEENNLSVFVYDTARPKSLLKIM